MAVDFSREVDYVARLARLKLDTEEKERMAGELGAILETAQKIRELDTEGIEPTAHVLNLPAVLREDQVRPALPLNRVLQNAPHRKQGYFRVPSIIVSEKQAE
jgi:aspartyl-tRNA(Asn)/glutamyl-tRNA(Gln) amidotransferase subunit C